MPALRSALHSNGAAAASSAQPTGTSPAPSPATAPSPPTAIPSVGPGDAPHGLATRLQIPVLEVDLPVMAGPLDADGNPAFPPCDVALYLDYYVQPGAWGTTYIYAHARAGMLAPLLEASKIDAGAALIGERVFVYTAQGWRHEYEITIVRPHATDYSLADDVGPTEERLVVQTSEGRIGDPLKLQVAARPMSVVPVPIEEALSSPMPRDCGPGA